jgi:hypothetical protein
MSGNEIETDAASCNHYALYIDHGTIDGSVGDGLFLTTQESMISDLEITNSHGWGLEVDNTCANGEISNVNNVTLRDNGILNGVGNLKIDSGSHDYRFSNVFAEGINHTPEWGFYFPDGLNVNGNYLASGDYANDNVGNFVFGSGASASTSTANSIDTLNPRGGAASIGTSTLSSTLFVQGTSSAPTIDLLDLASSTGSILFSLGATGSSTVGGGGVGTGLTINGSASTTGSSYIANSLVIGTQSILANKEFEIGGGGQNSLQGMAGIFVNPNSGNAEMTVENNAGVQGGWMSTSGSIYNGTWSNSKLVFRSNNNDRMALSAAGGLSIGSSYVGTDAGANNLLVQGTLGVGTTTPTGSLSVGGASFGTTNGVCYQVKAAGSASSYVWYYFVASGAQVDQTVTCSGTGTTTITTD